MVRYKRRYGKTSLLKHLIAALPAANATGVYVDLYGVVSSTEVIARLERAMLAFQPPRGQGRWLQARLRTFTRSANVRMGPVTLARSVQTGPPGSAEPGALEDRFAIFAELQERVGAPMIVVLDEFQAVLGASSNIDATIRSEIQHHERVGYIFAGSHVGMMRELFSDRSRPFYAQAPPVMLGPLPTEPLSAYVAERFEREDRDCQRVLGSLLDATRGHPQRSMMLAAYVFARTGSHLSAAPPRGNTAPAKARPARRSGHSPRRATSPQSQTPRRAGRSSTRSCRSGCAEVGEAERRSPRHLWRVRRRMAVYGVRSLTVRERGPSLPETLSRAAIT